MRMMIVLNRDGGTIRGMDSREFGDHVAQTLGANTLGQDPTDYVVKLAAGSEICEVLDQAASDKNIDGIIAGGGDGTISAAAAACFRAGKVLGVLPLGTMNLFARSLGLPLDPYEAVEALQQAEPRDLDIATANGRPFIHQYSVGLHERLISLRSHLDTSTRLRKMTATLNALGKVILAPPRLSVETSLEGETRRTIVSAVSVSNNLFGDSPVPFAPVLDGGVLGLYRARAYSSATVLRMTLDVARGALLDNPYVQVESAQQLVLKFPTRHRRAKAAIDGEIVDLESEIEFICHAGGLRVLTPSQPDPAKIG
ncbi:diacylglycerol/lipid kinase family protein [Hoeflea sp. Naph1]|uniref:diacylglycerol/lipid kinase family protein n=1 Tax=Hoeflea sp. Naph1 TaxID=3388653 RepID=UPI00398FCF12